MSITVMKQALEALEDPIAFAKGYAAITALRTAIEAAEKSNIRQAINLYDEPPAAQPCPYIRSTAEGTHHCALSQRQPLTDEQISDLWCEVSNTDFVTADTHVFARAVEAAHGIKGEA